MWSLGVLTYILLCGYMPFDDTYGRSSSFVTDFPDAEWANISSTAKAFVGGLIDKHPNTRMTSAQALDHAWLTGADAKGEDTKETPTLLASPQNLHIKRTHRKSIRRSGARSERFWAEAKSSLNSQFERAAEAVPSKISSRPQRFSGRRLVTSI